MNPTPEVNDNEITKAGLTRLLGVDKRTIARWTARGYFVPVRRKTGYPTVYSLPQVLAACREHWLRVDPAALATIAATK